MRAHFSAIAIAAALSACSPETLPTPAAPSISAPVARPPAGMRLYAINAGRMHAKAAMAFRGGRMDDPRIFGIGGILVEHPQGTLLFDAGFGPSVAEHIKTTPLMLRMTTKYDREPVVADQLRQAGIDPRQLTAVVLTHSHWDHVSGLEALPDVPVWVTEAERRFIDSGDRMTLLARRLGTSSYQTYDFPDGAYLGFDRSRDVFADGSVVLVPAPGHTPGSIIAFVNLPDGKRYALVGDLAWQREGIDLPSEKPWIARAVDHDRAGTRAMLVRIHQLKAAVPNLVVVPAHDRRVWDTLPKLPSAKASASEKV